MFNSKALFFAYGINAIQLCIELKDQDKLTLCEYCNALEQPNRPGAGLTPHKYLPFNAPYNGTVWQIKTKLFKLCSLESRFH